MPASLTERITSDLAKRIRGSVRRDEPVASHTSFNVGGPADIWIEPQHVGDISESLKLLRIWDCPVTILGNGTNVLVADAGIRGAVISLMRSFRTLTGDEDCVTAGAGVSMPALAQQTARMALTGYEWACGIPGSVGGSVVMNAGAHGGDTAGCLVEAQVVDFDEGDGWIAAADLGFSYRHSVLMAKAGVVTAARFKFRPDDPEAIRLRLQEFRDRRRAAQPETSQCAGSIFKNPPGGSAGRLLDGLGARGLRVGGAEVSEKHANFIVNRGGASATDVRNLIRQLIDKAQAEAGIELHPEVLMMGDWGAARDPGKPETQEAAG